MEQSIEQQITAHNMLNLVAVAGRRTGKAHVAKLAREIAKQSDVSVTDEKGNMLQSFAADGYFVPRISPLAWAIHITSKNLWRQHA